MIYTYDCKSEGGLPLSEFKRSFDRDGVIAVENILSGDHLHAMQIEADRCLRPGSVSDIGELRFLHRVDVENSQLGVDAQIYPAQLMMHLCHMRSEFHRHARSPSVSIILKHLFNSEVFLYTDLLFNKHTKGGEKTILHQDHAYYTDISPYNMITCWYALDDIDEDNGCLKYVLGSHKQLLHHDGMNGPHVLSINPQSISDQFTCAPVKAGTALFHHSLIVHGSEPNLSENRRRAVASVYIPSSAKISEKFSFPFGLCKL